MGRFNETKTVSCSRLTVASNDARAVLIEMTSLKLKSHICSQSNQNDPFYLLSNLTGAHRLLYDAQTSLSACWEDLRGVLHLDCSGCHCCYSHDEY